MPVCGLKSVAPTFFGPTPPPHITPVARISNIKLVRDHGGSTLAIHSSGTAVKVVQKVQITIQKRLISSVLEQSGEPPRIPALLHFLLGFRAVRHRPARLFGYGLRQEHVHTPVASQPLPE